VLVLGVPAAQINWLDVRPAAPTFAGEAAAARGAPKDD